MSRANRLCPTRKWREISILLANHVAIRDVSVRHLSRPETTDVISFCYEPMPGEVGLHTGEIIVNLELAVARGTDSRRMPPSRELALYVAHGCDHLTGANDNTPSRRRQMRRRELQWIREAFQRGRLNGLIL